MNQVRQLARPTDEHDPESVCDLLRADLDRDIAGWGEGDRDVYFTFDFEVITSFLQDI